MDKTDHNSSPGAVGSSELKSMGIMTCTLNLAVFTNTCQTLPDIRSGAVMNFTRPNKILQDRKKKPNWLND